MRNPIINLTEDTSQQVVESKPISNKVVVPSLNELEQKSKHREVYLAKIKNYITKDGQAKAPRRLEPNRA